MKNLCDNSLDKHRYVEPDIFIVCLGEWEGESLNTSPTLIVEVLSESTRDRDLGIKKDLYEKMGVKEYIVISQDRYIGIYRINENGKYNVAETHFYDIHNEEYNRNTIIFKSDYISELELTLNDIFNKVYIDV